MITRSVDPHDGIILVVGTGAWTRADVDDHYRDLRRMIAAHRAREIPIRVLSDITRAERQTPEIEAHIKTLIDATYQPGDRVALLTADTGQKLYVRGLLGQADVAAFSSRLPAEMWLMEPNLKPPV